MKQMHLDRDEYLAYLDLHNLESKIHVLVLDCGVAGYVNYVIHNNTLVFEDYFYADDDLLQKHFKHAFNILHAEIYWKLALVHKCYTEKS